MIIPIYKNDYFDSLTLLEYAALKNAALQKLLIPKTYKVDWG